ncbi:helix-turn-helix transcriptional regulator [Natranaerobius thermophilus]|uniref:Transcriptional regulator, XRE family n=1 Tax=Natranaerobius thermophilus (strain ATCC BAA-1301 / DSM 18059 / JW/NM-WN-LF) TaxID=457570 RepID=B2A1D0_NATTJ|nr:helix-turn-helix transcriptional regulator [Natranaerobius thermophilus]ACB86068.1 transcriptional regulator, XRE family [Natranaerobius thermophilus JW/NM-WN-LF]
MNGILGEQIRVLRESAGKTQEEIAFKMNCSRQKIARIEKGLVDISYSNILDIARILQISPREITSVIEDEENSQPMYRVNGANYADDQFNFINDMINTFYAHRRLYNSLKEVDDNGQK